MRYLVKINELGKKIDYLKKQLDIIDEKIISLENEKKSLTWQGVASTTFNNKYDQYILKLKKIEKSTVVCIDYFMQYYDKYGQGYRDFKKKYARFYKPEVKDELSSL